ncbi:NUDIX domain-containing protein [Nocardioides sp. J2M5]|uniref:NUDIX domain-containing protein n=1 Tax=Nocardioides palaemonis TaxID=2829810 RepID=UPI001BA645F9|nr:NUDIX domain-containing protein [Nocardioides palaemonis]MBS2939662.1 NUDIX domain-containing protein [Nocardioides palaemonis]
MIEVSVGALVRDGRVLLAHRSPHKHAYPDTWDLPGGVVEPGESPVAGLVRELREELGVEVAAVSVEPLCEVTVSPAGEPVLLRAWLVREWHGEPVNLAPDEHDDLAWYGLDELPPMGHHAVRDALAAGPGQPNGGSRRS